MFRCTAPGVGRPPDPLSISDRARRSPPHPFCATATTTATCASRDRTFRWFMPSVGLFLLCMFRFSIGTCTQVPPRAAPTALYYGYYYRGVPLSRHHSVLASRAWRFSSWRLAGTFTPRPTLTARTRCQAAATATSRASTLCWGTTPVVPHHASRMCPYGSSHSRCLPTSCPTSIRHYHR